MKQLKNNPKNDRVKRDYLIWLTETRGRTSATAEQARSAIDRLETYTGYKDFGTFNKEQAVAFKHALMESKAVRSGKPISISTIHHTLHALREFLIWLHGVKGYSRRVTTANIAYLNLTMADERRARVTAPKKYATLEEYRIALFAMPVATEIERRDQALMALMLLTCMRDAAAISLKLKHIDITSKRVFQDPREVKTKFSKVIDTYFYPVGDDVALIVQRWVEFLIHEKHFTLDMPLFPKTINGHDANHSFVAARLGAEHWANATPVRKLFKSAFERVGLPYYNPHSIRNTLTKLAYQLKLPPEELKAWSQNMGHENLLTTFNSYGFVAPERQAEIMCNLAKPKENAAPFGDIADAIAEKVATLLQSTK